MTAPKVQDTGYQALRELHELGGDMDDRWFRTEGEAFFVGHGRRTERFLALIEEGERVARS